MQIVNTRKCVLLLVWVALPYAVLTQSVTVIDGSCDTPTKNTPETEHTTTREAVDTATESSNETEPDVVLSSCGAEQYLSPTHVIDGFHLLCVSPNQTNNLLLDLEIFVDGSNLLNSWVHKTVSASWTELRNELEQFLLLEYLSGSNPFNKYPWQMYTSNGILIQTLEQVLDAKLVFVFQGGLFIWPGVFIGHNYTLTDLDGTESITMTTLSMKPLVFEMKNFLTPEECEHIKTTATPLLMPSPVSKMDHDQDKPNTYWRTSHNCFLTSTDDPILLKIDQRVEDLTKIPKLYQESVQVLRYELGQRYSAHHDYFPPEHYQSESNKHIMEMIDYGRRNRIITVFWYLSDVESGGETIFPRAGGKPEVSDFNSCEEGLKVKPERGKVIMFYSMKPNAQFDPFSLHGACPVHEGIKWAANKWVWTNTLDN